LDGNFINYDVEGRLKAPPTAGWYSFFSLGLICDGRAALRLYAHANRQAHIT